MIRLLFQPPDALTGEKIGLLLSLAHIHSNIKCLANPTNNYH